MNICEGCIKQDVCKFKEEIGKGCPDLPEPLEFVVTCKYKYIGEIWDEYPYDYSVETRSDCNTTTTCGKEW